MAKGTDFKWLATQAKNNKTKEVLDLIKNETLKNSRLHSLKLGNYEIVVSKKGALSSLYTYQEQFKDKDHMKVPSFSGRNAKVVLDIGANEGFYTLRTKKYSPSCTIIAVEPVPSTFKLLKKNIYGNKLKDVYLVNKAVSCSKTVNIEFVEELSSISGTKLNKIKDMFINKTKSISKAAHAGAKSLLTKVKSINVKAVSISELCKKYKLARIDIMKIDVEGSELDVLNSAKDVLKNINKIVIEYHGKKKDGSDVIPKIKTFLKAYNFKVILEEKAEWGCGDLYFINSKQK